MISKTLAARLQKVISAVICDAQDRFILGRKIADNIILAHELVKSYIRKHISARYMIKLIYRKHMTLWNGLT